MTTVLHYVEHWLDLSSGFVHGHVSRSQHRALVVSHNRVENRDAFPQRPLVSLHPLVRRVPARAWPAQRTLILRALATAYRVGVVHVHFGFVVGDVLDAVRRSRLPLVLSLHGNDATAVPAAHPAHYEEAVELATAVIVPSRFLAGVVADLGFPADRLHVVPAGIDTTFFTPSPLPDEPVVTFVGRLVEKKGIDVLLAAWPEVVAAVPQARLAILGAGPLAGSIPSDDRSIHHVVPQPERRAEQARELIRSARVVVTPSRTATSGDAESLLLVNLEAQASGRPVVTTRHGGIPEFVAADESALVVPENDPGALAAALIRVLTDGTLATTLAAHGPRVAAGFDIADSVRRVDALYDELVAGRRR